LASWSRSIARASSSGPTTAATKGSPAASSRTRRSKPGGADRAHLQAEVAKRAAQVVLQVLDLALEQLARGEQEPPSLARRRLDVHRLEQADAHHLGDAVGVVPVGLVDPGRQRGVHVPGLDADRGQPRLDQAGVEPGRHRARLEPDPAEADPATEQPGHDGRRLALGRGARDDAALLVDDADGGLLHGDVEPDEVLHGGLPVPVGTGRPSCRS
jgi:hypothetical protein